MEQEHGENRFDRGSLTGHYFHLALPVVVGSIITIIYSLADTYFIAQTGNALLVAGVSVCAPLFTILMAFGTLSQVSPVTIPMQISVLPTPVENAPSAPYVQV